MHSSVLSFNFQSSPKGKTVIAYVLFLVFRSLLSFLEKGLLEGSSYARCDQSSNLIICTYFLRAKNKIHFHRPRNRTYIQGFAIGFSLRKKGDHTLSSVQFRRNLRILGPIAARHINGSSSEKRQIQIQPIMQRQ